MTDRGDVACSWTEEQVCHGWQLFGRTVRKHKVIQCAGTECHVRDAKLQRTGQYAGTDG